MGGGGRLYTPPSSYYYLTIATYDVIIIVQSLGGTQVNNTTFSNQDYLEAILTNEKDGKTKSVDIAHALNVTKPAVHIAINNLIAKGLVTKESYGAIVLTDKGRSIANDVLNRHNILKCFLLGIGVDEQIANEDCCKLEHVVSNETLLCLIAHCKKHGIEL